MKTKNIELNTSECFIIREIINNELKDISELSKNRFINKKSIDEYKERLLSIYNKL